jgi:hypothetical protein
MKYAKTRTEATQQKLRYFFSDRPCREGHIGLRKLNGLGGSNCYECIKLKSRLERQRRQIEGHQSRSKRWRADNPEAAKLRGKIRREKDPIRYRLAMVKHRAKVIGVEFNLTREDIHIPTHCPVLGIQLRISNRPRDPYSPSVDRIDSRKGYTKDNIVIVSNRVNALKGDATVEELVKIAAFYQGLTR